MQQEIVL